MTGTLRHCANGGSLVGVRQWLPNEPFDYDWGRTNPQIGCNNIGCGSCGGPVTATTATKHSRKYQCGCAEYVADRQTPLRPDGYPGSARGRAVAIRR